MAKIPGISDAEWAVMNVLWAAADALTANEVVEHLSGRTKWNPRTIKTMLNRLVRKGALAYQTQGNRYLYRPKVSREACVSAKSRSFAARVFGGAVGPMLAHFVDTADLTPQDIEQLKQVLARKER
jgi:BlaI family penicillinase repressor